MRREGAAGLRVHDVHGKRLVTVHITRQRDQHPIAVALRFGRLAVDVATPERRIRRQLESLELFLIVLHHEGSLGEHFAALGQHRGDLRAVGHGFEHRFRGVTPHVQRQVILAAAILPGQHDGAGDE